MIIKKSVPENPCQNQIILLDESLDFSTLQLTTPEEEYLQRRLLEEHHFIEINRYTSILLFVKIALLADENLTAEAWRRRGNEMAQWAKNEKIASVELISLSDNPENLLAFAEGAWLGSYQFLKYCSKAEKKRNNLSEIFVAGNSVTGEQLESLTILMKAVFKARDLTNEPVIHLNAEKIAVEFEKMCSEAGVQAEILNKKKIESLNMGGLLAVNSGSPDEPTFSVLEYLPANPVNDRPIVLIGKGVVFDTGGLSLKPTAKSMDYMKSDMAGAAAVAGAICAAAGCRLPIHLITLIPATDNRPGGNAVTPGDIITISNGATVEVLNTDAEGRLILADALCYAQRYDPMLVIDLATLTGSAAMTLGIHGIAAMTNSQDGVLFPLLKKAGDRVNERMVELPLWDEYDEMIKSNIADMKNIGSGDAGAITAGKFLQRFVDYPWVHLDIAGPAFLHAADHYRPVGGTAAGVRLLYDFFNLFIQSTRSDSNS